ncbi:MAG: transglycosylase SLT domain-containing protein [Streptosporangiales bacterium]
MRQAGFPKSAIRTGVAIAFAESSGNPTATNHNVGGSTDYGLFQINSVHQSILAQGDWSNPLSNTKMAYHVWANSGHSWSPWTTYNSGAYKQFLDKNISGNGSSSGTTNNIFDNIMDPHNWYRIGLFILGGLAVVASFWYIVTKTNIGSKANRMVVNNGRRIAGKTSH